MPRAFPLILAVLPNATLIPFGARHPHFSTPTRAVMPSSYGCFSFSMFVT